MYICHRCGSFDILLKAQKEEDYVGGSREGLPRVDFVSYKELLVCGDCNYTVYDEDIEEENLKRKFDIYCTLSGILLPSQIINIIRGCGLTKEEFSELVGIDIDDIEDVYRG